jgi:hypothetical protein
MVQAIPARSQEPERTSLIAPAVPGLAPDVADIIHRLSDEGLPRGALRDAVENWDRVLPVFLEMLDGYIQDPDGNEVCADPLFFIVHLFGQMRETRAYPLLMRFAAMAPERFERVIGDGVTATFSRVAASVFDGDPQPMRDVILNEQVDEFVRSGLLEALALVTRDGRADRKSTEAFLVQCYADLKPQHDCYAWVGWQSAISYLGLGDLADLVRRAFASGRIDPGVMSFQHGGAVAAEVGRSCRCRSRTGRCEVGEAARPPARERPLSVRQREKIQEVLPRQVGPPYIRSRALLGSYSGSLPTFAGRRSPKISMSSAVPGLARSVRT